MERENLFLILTILLMLIIAIYEAVSLGKKNAIFGSYYDIYKFDGGADQEEMVIDGITLPPILEYKSALKIAMIKALNGIVNASKNEQSIKMSRDFGRYYDKGFSRFMFALNTHGKLSKNLVPKEYPVDMEDMEYFMNTYGMSSYADKFRRYPLPYWPKFNSLGPKVIARFEGNDTMINSITSQTLPITPIQYNRLKSIYSGPPELFDNMAYTVLYVYHSLGGLGNNGSVPIGLIDDSYIELFGSPLNTQQRYCSPFFFEKTYFNSLGSFYDYHLVKNQKYTCNPPYIDSLMTEAARRVTSQMKEHGPGSNISVLVVIPIWDAQGLGEIGEPKKDDDPNKNAKYPSKEIIESSGLVRAKKSLHKNDHKYYSWYGNKLVAYSHTYLYVLSTEEVPGIDLNEIIARWDTLISVFEPVI